ncbi:MAG: NAD(P)/FAD-dependent oxidoreductase [Actinomycetota bacterium]|nr:NAD(P)/FAD-dependent oxidoreductase [Actinomycetota bacterium]MDQ3719700.1 NAD(P)/FAD-dependent oxidoreductase [Actinomycetota bacterium]
MSVARYDALVMGAGPAGEVAVSRLNGQGLKVALVERELLGGECGYWACIPSKTLLRPPEARSEAERAAGVGAPAVSWPEVAAYRDTMIRHLDDSAQVSGYGQEGVDVFKSEGKIARPGQVEVEGQALHTDRIIVATGSDARIPPVDGLKEAGYWTNREATTLSEIPDSIVVLGGGPVGVELGQLMRRFGARVTIVEHGERLLSREDPAVGELIGDTLRAEGIELCLGAQATAVERRDGERIVRLDDGVEVSGRELLVATGRAPRVHGIGLESIGIEPDPEGLEVDERCRAAEGVWAIGDVTGVMPFTHVGMYQGRITAQDIAGEQPRADYAAIPRVVFSDPEVAAVGLTEQQAREQRVEIATARIVLGEAIARPSTYEENPRGELGLIADHRRQVLVGAWAVAPLASEWIHYAALAIKTQTPLPVLRDTVAQFPTFTEAYLKGLEALEP